MWEIMKKYVGNVKRCTGNVWKIDGNEGNFELSPSIQAPGLRKIPSFPLRSGIVKISGSPVSLNTGRR